LPSCEIFNDHRAPVKYLLNDDRIIWFDDIRVRRR
jgi:hypothetical protein